jgi:hypothetical protein
MYTASATAAVRTPAIITLVLLIALIVYRQSDMKGRALLRAPVTSVTSDEEGFEVQQFAIDVVSSADELPEHASQNRT